MSEPLDPNPGKEIEDLTEDVPEEEKEEVRRLLAEEFEEEAS